MNPDTGMQVSAERVSRLRRVGQMAGEERWQRMRLVDAANGPVAWWVAGPRVVIAPHEHYVEGRVPAAPCDEGIIERGDAPGPGVQQIAQHHESRCIGALDQARQPCEIRCSRSARQRNAAGAECGRLPEVNIGDEQRARAKPIQCALGVQCDAFSAGDRRQYAVDRA